MNDQDRVFRMTEGAVKPWHSPDRAIPSDEIRRKDREAKRSDTKEQIKRCINCPYARCIETYDACAYRLYGREERK